MFNLGYQLLHQHIYSIFHTLGLHPDYAIYHRESDCEFPLVWDLMGEFRTPIVDDLVISLVRDRHLTNKNGNGTKHSRSLLKVFLQHWEMKLSTRVLHPYAGEVSYRQCLELQVPEYIACLLGEVSYYRPLALKFNPAHSHSTVSEQRKKAIALVK